MIRGGKPSKVEVFLFLCGGTLRSVTGAAQKLGYATAGVK